MTEKQWETITHFKASEFQNPNEMSYKLILLLDSLRHLIQRPINITSSFRTSTRHVSVDHNVTHRPGTSTHNLGEAVDISCTNSLHRYTLVSAALRTGFLRIGIYDAHIHLDLGSDFHEPMALWIGISQ